MPGRVRRPVSHLPPGPQAAERQVQPRGTSDDRRDPAPLVPPPAIRPSASPPTSAEVEAEAIARIRAPLAVTRGSLVRFVAVTILAIIAFFAHLMVGALTLLFLALTPDPGSEIGLATFKVIMAAGWIGFLTLLAYAEMRVSWLVVLVPVASFVFFWIIGQAAGNYAPGSLDIGY